MIQPLPKSKVTIPDEVFRLAIESNRFFERLNGDTAEMHARDVLNLERPYKHAETLQRYTSFANARILEIGSGYGANIAVWIKDLGADAVGVEPSAPEWGNSSLASKMLLSANGIDGGRIIDGVAESLPFSNETFDIVYSSNVLEHVNDPVGSLKEAIRVLRPGGVLHFEIPNFASYYESHYSIIQPPAFNRALLRGWVRLRGKDARFVDTLNLINPAWCRKTIRSINEGKQTVKILSLGEEIFLERLSQPWRFETEQQVSVVSALVSTVQKLNFGNWIGRMIVLAQGFYPLLLTLQKEE